jgi:hypothetical protein
MKINKVGLSNSNQYLWWRNPMTNNRVTFTVLTLAASFIAMPAFGATPAGTSGIKITTGAPKRPADGMFSINTKYRLDGDITYESTGVVLGLGAAKNPPDTAAGLSVQLSDSIAKSMTFQQPEWRGIGSKQAIGPDGTPLPEWQLLNMEGFSLTRAVFRDYSNAQLTFTTLAGTFANADVKVGIDVVDALEAINPAEADYYAGQSGAEKPSALSAGGTITITVGSSAPVQIETKGKSPEEIEEMLAEKLASSGADTSGSPIVPDAEDQTMLRQIPPFDGGEVQFKSLEAPSITVDVNDPNLGVITKFGFKDPGGSASDSVLSYALPILLLAGVGLYYYKDSLLKKKEGENV